MKGKRRIEGLTVWHQAAGSNWEHQFFVSGKFQSSTEVVAKLTQCLEFLYSEEESCLIDADNLRILATLLRGFIITGVAIHLIAERHHMRIRIRSQVKERYELPRKCTFFFVGKMSISTVCFSRYVPRLASSPVKINEPLLDLVNEIIAPDNRGPRSTWMQGSNSQS